MLLYPKFLTMPILTPKVNETIFVWTWVGRIHHAILLEFSNYKVCNFVSDPNSVISNIPKPNAYKSDLHFCKTGFATLGLNPDRRVMCTSNGLTSPDAHQFVKLKVHPFPDIPPQISMFLRFQIGGERQGQKRYCSSSHTLQFTDFHLIVFCI